MQGPQPKSPSPGAHGLREMLQMAYDRGYLRMDLSRKVVLQKEARPEIVPLSFAEEEGLLKALPVRWRRYFAGAFGTGLRPSEQVALTWDRIDFARNKIEIREGWRRGQRTALKVPAANRDVDILPPVRKALEQQRLIAVGSEQVFPNWRGGHINVSNLRKRDAIEELGHFDPGHTLGTVQAQPS